MPKCTINGKEVEVQQGSTIIEAFMKCGSEIAHYCWHPGLSVAGVCRMCVVDIQGNPRPQIACNTQVTEGMVINNTSDKIKDAVKWVLEFHLINHPLDCPICDQAGECGLQEYYMKHGQYEPEMGERKVKKRKVVSLGSTVVLDTERCILCSRCVRFTDEITKTHELGIFNRGDHSEVGTHEDRPLENNYSLNVVDICPVGALTSKDFRFRQRVWFLKDFESVCTGCSTGCNTRVYYNENGLYRIKPVFNKEINGHWMCDEGRGTYKYVNLEARLTKALRTEGGRVSELAPLAAAQEVGQALKATVASHGAAGVGLVITAQYTSEELESVVKTFAQDFGSQNIFYWKNNPEKFEAFDGILNRGDKNPNTTGLLKVLDQYGIKTKWEDLAPAIQSGKIKTLVVAGPENQAVYPDLKDKVAAFSKVEKVVWLTAGKNAAFTGFAYQIPMKAMVEKSGTLVNYKGIEQKVKKGVAIVTEALTLSDAAAAFAGKEVTLPHASAVYSSVTI